MAEDATDNQAKFYPLRLLQNLLDLLWKYSNEDGYVLYSQSTILGGRKRAIEDGIGNTSVVTTYEFGRIERRILKPLGVVEIFTFDRGVGTAPICKVLQREISVEAYVEFYRHPDDPVVATLAIRSARLEETRRQLQRESADADTVPEMADTFADDFDHTTETLPPDAEQPIGHGDA